MAPLGHGLINETKTQKSARTLITENRALSTENSLFSVSTSDCSERLTQTEAKSLAALFLPCFSLAPFTKYETNTQTPPKPPHQHHHHHHWATEQSKRVEIAHVSKLCEHNIKIQVYIQGVPQLKFSNIYRKQKKISTARKKH